MTSIYTKNLNFFHFVFSAIKLRFALNKRHRIQYFDLFSPGLPSLKLKIDQIQDKQFFSSIK